MMNVLTFFIQTFAALFVSFIAVMAILSACNLLPEKMVRWRKNAAFELSRSAHWKQIFAGLGLDSQYQRKQAEATYAVIIRYARGNVLFQHGLLYDDEMLKNDSKRADRILRLLTRTI